MSQPVPSTVRIGTRGSALARWQTDNVAERLRAAWPGLDVQLTVMTTHGDRVLDTPLPLIGGKGVFTAELEAALRDHTVDFAVHSLKDLPTENPPGLTVGATPERADPRDTLISRAGYTLDTLPHGATIGTSSRRRAAQLLSRRPDLKMADIRGNVDTRIRKALDPDGPYDAILLAAAGLERLGLAGHVSQYLPLDVMLPAPGQASMAVQCRDEAESLTMLAPVNHLPTALAITAERAFLAGLGGGCSLPIAAFAAVTDGEIHLRGRVNAPDGSEQVDVEARGAATLPDAHALGVELASAALARGVGTILEAIR
jgi:hydroxymethylbilane synthase